MKIVHIAPNAPYNEGWGYQENLLPKHHRILGHEVTLIITNLMHQNGEIIETTCADYINGDNVRVIRLAKKDYRWKKITSLFSTLDVFQLLQDLQPDFIFFHGLVSKTIFEVISYKNRNRQNCIIVQDNHLDTYNSKNTRSLVGKFLRYYYRMLNKKSQKYIDKIYGVTPGRVEFARDYFKINQEKLDLLIQGADDEHVLFGKRHEIRNRIRQEYEICDEDFLVVTGGKISKDKGLIPLMEAVQGIDSLKLLIFGSIENDIKEKFEELLSPDIIYVGWIHSNSVYEYFLAGDLAFFPGSHSVLWEQACASKIPCVFNNLPGVTHLDNGGNAKFIDSISNDSIEKILNELNETTEYSKMLEVAQSSKTDIYLYSHIAEKSLRI